MKIYSTDGKPPTDFHVAKPLTGKQIRKAVKKNYKKYLKKLEKDKYSQTPFL